ncbi:3-oxoacyl-ACP synthase, partial [Acinetobacter baumannii]
VPAIEEILHKKGMAATDIDCIICATVTPDMVFPATANIIADKIGATNAWGYDMSAACSGFLYALTTGAMYIESGRFK